MPKTATPDKPVTPEPAPVTPAVTPAPDAPAPEKKDITDVLREDSTIKNMLVTKKKAKKEEPVAAAPAPAATPAPSAPPAAPAAPEPKPLKVRKAAAPAPSGMTPEQIAQLAAETAVRVSPKPAEPVAPAKFELPEALHQNAPVYEQLEKLNPKKYADIGRKQAEFMQKEVDYASQWEDGEIKRLQAEGKYDPENPPVYDAEDPRHSKFYEKNQVVIDPRDLKKAEFEALWSEKYNSEVKPKLTEADQTIARLRAAPEAQNAVAAFGAHLLHSLNPEGKQTEEAFKKWTEENPIESEVAAQVVEQIKPVVHSASLLWDGAIQFDQNNESHVVAASVFNTFEKQLSESAEPITDEKNRTWVPLAKFQQMNPAEKSKHFTTTKENLINYISLESSARVKNLAKQQREFAEKTATRLGYKKVEPSPVAGQPSSAPVAKPASAAPSPSISSGAPISPSSGAAPAPAPEKGGVFGKMLGVK